MTETAFDIAIGRQPICDGDGRVRGYELLFRDGAADRASYGSADTATAEVLVGAFADIGLRRLLLGRPGFVNVTEALLVEHDLPLAGQPVVPELPSVPEASPELLGAVDRLRAAGVHLAVDHADRTTDPRLLARATYAKVDVLATDLAGMRPLLAAFTAAGVQPIALRVADGEAQERLQALGFRWFQGHWFCRPVTVRGRRPASSAASALRTAAVLAKPNVTPEEVVDVLTADPPLTVRVLRLLNSAAVPTNRTMTSVRDGLALLGLRTIREWATLMALAATRPHHEEVIPLALVRARTLQLLAERRGDDPGAAFVVGLFSLSDAILGVPLDEAIADLPLADAVRAALLDGAGPDGEALAALRRVEDGAMPALEQATASTEAMRWAGEKLAGLA